MKLLLLIRMLKFQISVEILRYANEIIYDKNNEIITANKNIKFQISVVLRYMQAIIYEKNNEIIAKDNAKALYIDEKIITATKFNYDIINNVLNAKGTVRALDKLNNQEQLKNCILNLKEKINSSGKTSIFVRENYKIDGTNIQFLIKKLLKF